MAARADDSRGTVLSLVPNGPGVDAVTLHVPAQASEGSMPLFLRQSGVEALTGVRLSATPLLDEDGTEATTPTFDPPDSNIPASGGLLQVALKVAKLTTLGTFTSSLFATSGNRVQTPATLAVVHIRKSNALQVQQIQTARASKFFPGVRTHVTMLVTIRNNGNTDILFSKPVIADLSVGPHRLLEMKKGVGWEVRSRAPS